MLVGYARISKADGSQSLDLQRDALAAAGVAPEQIYEDRASGKRDDRPGLEACLKALRDGDALVVWKLDRLGRDLAHLVAIVRDLERRGVAEFERDLIHERVMAGLSAARARGRRGGARLQDDRSQAPARAGGDGKPGDQGPRALPGDRRLEPDPLPPRRS